MRKEHIDSLSVREITLLDPQDRQRFRVACNPNGDAVLQFLSAKQEITVALGADGDGNPILQITTPQEPNLFAVTLNEVGPVVNIVGKDYRGKITLQFSDEGQPLILLTDRDGADRYALCLDTNGEPVAYNIPPPPLD